MINMIEAREPFRVRIKDSGIIPTTSIEWENRIFNPKGKTLWMRESIFAVDENFLTSKYDVNGSILRYQILGKIGDSSGEQAVVNAGIAIANLFSTAEVITTDNYSISIDSTKQPFQGKLDEMWYGMNIDIHIRVYE